MNDYSPDQLDAIWVEYQEQNVAHCPNCNTELTLELEDQTDGANHPVVHIACPGCGREGENEPYKRNHSE